LIFELRARDAQVGLLEKRVIELETENQRLWNAMRSTGELLGKLLREGD
jgi:hypothetical protein